MRVAYITSQFPVPSETFAASDIRELLRRGVEVQVFGYRPDRRDHAQLLEQRGLARLPVRNCGLRRQLGGLLQAMVQPLLTTSLLIWILRNEWSRPPKLIRALLLVPAFFYVHSRLRRERPDVVHLFWGQYTVILGFLLKRTMPGVHLSMFLGAHDLVARLGISSDIAGRADSLFTHAHANLPALEHMGIAKQRVTVVHRGVDTEWVQTQLGNSDAGSAAPVEIPAESGSAQAPVQNSVQAPAQTPGQKEPGLILSAGRLQSYKGFDDVLRVFAALKSRQPHVRLQILGEGPDRPRLEELARTLGVSGAVSFCGHLPHGEVLRRMAGAQLFLFMSRHDGERLPNSVKEAMLCRCICITTETPGIDELLDHGRTGFIVAQGDVDAAAAYAAEAAAGGRPEMPEAARREILERFSVRTAMQKYLDRWSREGENNE